MIMSRILLLLAIAVTASLAPMLGCAEPALTLKSVTVDLLDPGRMFPGPGQTPSTTIASPAIRPG